jgi:hypothetical protein
MRSVEGPDLRGGACQGLPPGVADKYFQANGHTDRFQYLTAKMICMGCPVQLACLMDAIEHPQRGGVRGGESAPAIRALNYQHRQERTPVERLGRTAIRHQLAPFRGAYGDANLRAGNFPDMTLTFPEPINEGGDL